MDLFNLYVFMHHFVDFLFLSYPSDLVVILILPGKVFRISCFMVNFFTVYGRKVHSLVCRDPLTHFSTSVMPKLHPEVQTVFRENDSS